MSPRALVVDDEPDIRELITLTLKRMGLEVVSAENLQAAYLALARQQVDLCLTDMRLPDGNGLELVEHIGREHPHIPVAMITAYGNTEAAVQALKAGAFDFVSKPLDLKVLRGLVEAALKLARLEEAAPKDGLGDDTGARPSVQLIGSSPPMEQVRRLIARLARSQAPVFITGASGTGKELAARLIHQQGPRRDRPFVAVNCGAIPGELMESEFFGHRKGSFTGAVRDHDGLFVQAHGGTLFLDEVADLPLHMQVKLLRALQEKRIRPLGAEQEVAVDVRILSASHKAMAPLVAEGRFREDLYYRLNVIELRMPTLAERPEDIPELARHLLGKLAAQWHIAPPQLASDALQRLQQHPWPGNVRELENTLERALTLSDQQHIRAADLHFPSATADGTTGCLRPAAVPLEQWLEQLERQELQRALATCGGNKTRAAEHLGLSFRSLRYRLKKLGLENGDN